MKRFDGKTAWWVWFLFIVYNLVPTFIVVFDSSFVWNLATITGFIACYLLDILWLPIMIRDWVDVYDDYFVFYYGFLKFVVKFENIVEVKKSHNPMSATANSFDRICIQTKQRNIYLALYKNDEFIELIESKIAKNSK